MFRSPAMLLAGALLTGAVALTAGHYTARPLAARLDARAHAALDPDERRRVRISFATPGGSPSRQALLTPVGDPGDGTRREIAQKISRVPGVGGVFWTDGSMLAQSSDQPLQPLHCQDDVQALLAARTLRFEESSADITPESQNLLGEVATALRPCVGAIIAINGHTDSSGPPEVNLALSHARANTVRRELIARGIPADGLIAKGYGSSRPIPGLVPTDPANRRIEFSVIEKVKLRPTPIDTPGAR